jgi:acetyl-CoA acetyltransferase
MKARKLGRGIAIVAAGSSPFGSFPEKSGRDLFSEAYLDMLASVEKGIDPRSIEAAFIGNFSSELFENQGQSAPLLANWVGLQGIPAVRVEDACASGGVALRQAILAVASGLYDLVLAAGLEKMSGLPLQRTTDILSTAADQSYETSAGFTFPGFYGAVASAYQAAFHADLRLLQDISIKNHANAALNEKAHLRSTVAGAMKKTAARRVMNGEPEPEWADEHDFLEDPRANPFIAYPLRLFDCAPITDGAAALLVASGDIARSFTAAPLYCIGAGQASDGPLFERANLASLGASVHAAAQAYDMAGVGPRDIRIAEVHDCFTIAEAVALEDLGFCAAGTGIFAAREGFTARDGPLPVNSSGGLKAKGHPVGATGIGQVVELWEQMHAAAGPRQVRGDLSLALAHNVGGTGQTCTVHIFERG